MTINIDRRKLILSGAVIAGAGLLGARPVRAQDFIKAPRVKGGVGEDARFVAPAQFYKKEPEQKVTCRLCPRECKVAESERGFCGVRENRGGDYFTLVHSRPCALHLDPIEKKPLFHFLPSTRAFSLATAGCNVECKFCQNWNISQFRPEDVEANYLNPPSVAKAARSSGAASIAYTYSEPVVYYEYMSDCVDAAKKLGVRSVMISNGYIKPEPLAKLAPRLDAIKIDLKGFSEKFYAEQCNGKMAPVLDSLKVIRSAGTWLEIVMLVIPTLNDSVEEVRLMARWIRNYLGADTPLHFSRFHNAYKITNLYPTPMNTLRQLRNATMDEGLKYVYIGNAPGNPGGNTYCPKCKKVVIERYGFLVKSVQISNGKCNYCGEPIAGVWS